MAKHLNRHLQRQHKDGQQVCKQMLNTANHQGNATQNQTTPPHTHQHTCTHTRAHAHTHTGILFSHRKGWSFAICDTVDKSRGHSAACSSLTYDLTGRGIWKHTHTPMLTDTENRLVVVRGGKWGWRMEWVNVSTLSHKIKVVRVKRTAWCLQSCKVQLLYRIFKSCQILTTRKRFSNYVRWWMYQMNEMYCDHGEQREVKGADPWHSQKSTCNFRLPKI